MCVQSQTLSPFEEDALETLFPALGYPACTSSCTQCASWSGVTCSSGSVEVINLQDLGLSGTIPSVIGDFSQLQSLNLFSNDLIGTIPSQIGKLSQLQFLELFDNNLIGTIPSQIGKLSQLEILDPDTNKLNGTIPSQIGMLSQLNALYLYNNNLTGTIPSQIGELSHLNYLTLSNNKLTGEIPFQLQNLGSLIQCNVWFGNDLTCDPTYPPGVTRCMGTASYYDNNGDYDAPNCTISLSTSTSSRSSTISTTRSTSSSSPASSTHVVSYTITWSKFANPNLVRIQYQSQTSKGGWLSKNVGNTQTTYTFTGLLPSTKYEYRLVVKTKTVTTTSATYTFTTPAS